MATTIAEDMVRLTEDMIAANHARLQAVDTLATGTRATLRRFHADRSKMATDQARDLAGFAGGLSKEVDEMRRKAQGLVKEFDTANRRMSQEQSKRLAGFVQSLARDVTSMLSRFDKERGRLSKELGEQLARQIAEIKASVERILKDSGSFMHEQRTGMAKARQAWRSMSAALHKAGKRDSTMPAAEPGHKACSSKPAASKTRAKKDAARTSR